MQCALRNSMASRPATPAQWVGWRRWCWRRRWCSAPPCVLRSRGTRRLSLRPGDAVLALYNAAKANDSQTADRDLRFQRRDDIIHTGDNVADKNMRTDFIKRYDQMHRVVLEPDGTVTLYVGAENWPFPVSIVKNTGGSWYFDTEAARKKFSIAASDATKMMPSTSCIRWSMPSTITSPRLTTATRPSTMRRSSSATRASRTACTGRPATTIRPARLAHFSCRLPVKATTCSRASSSLITATIYRILTKQGAAAKGGARDYIVNGQLTKGFAFVAYPAEYRNSGVVTFIVNQDGVVYEKDLGADTAKIAEFHDGVQP